MNPETKLMIGISSVVSFMKDQVATTLIEANNSKTIDLKPIELERITNLVQASIQASFTKASTEVESIVRDFTKN